VYQEFGSDDALVQALLDGEIDVIDQVPLEAAPALEEAGNVEVAVLPTTTMDELIINSFKKGTQPDSLNEPAVRLAIAHALDERQVAEAAHLGYAAPGTTVVPTSMGGWHNGDIWDIPFDLNEANLVLNRAGFVDSDDDGIREDAKGRPLEYRLYAEDGVAERQILESFADNLAQIGISALPTLMSEDSLYGLYPDYDFDLVYWGWDLDPDPGFAMSIFTCDQREEDGWNDSGYCDEEFDEMYQRQASTVDPDARRELIHAMQVKLFDERPYIVLTYAQNVQAYRSDRFRGFGLGSPSILWKSSFLPARPLVE
jgi:peptide/nickel transport system substrate-binding protein